MEAKDTTQRVWIEKIRSRIYPDRYLLAISLNTKLNIYLSVYQISCFFPLTKYKLFKILFLNHNFPLHVTRHVTKPMTELGFVHSHWTFLWSQGSSDQLTCLETPPFYNSNCSILNRSASPFGKAQLIDHTNGNRIRLL